MLEKLIQEVPTAFLLLPLLTSSSALEAGDITSRRALMQIFLFSSANPLIPSDEGYSVADIKFLGCYSCGFLCDPAHTYCHAVKSVFLLPLMRKHK